MKNPRSGAKIKNGGGTPLHMAMQHNKLEDVKKLLDAGADVNAKDWKGWTLLHWAARKNTVEVAKLLIHNGADVNAKEEDGRTPLHWAAFSNASDTAKLLIEGGANIKAKDVGGRTPLHVTALGNTAIRKNVARKRNAGEVAQLLIESGANIEAKAKGNTPLHAAAFSNAPEIAKILIASGAKVNVKEGKFGAAPLHMAAWENALEVAKMLIANSAKVNVKTKDGRTPMDFAIHGGHAKMQSLLREHGGRCVEKRFQAKSENRENRRAKMNEDEIPNDTQEIDPDRNIWTVCRELVLFDDTYLNMQAMNIAMVDGYITNCEHQLLQEYHEKEKTPVDTAFFVSALSQMWLFALYELLRTWRQRINTLKKWRDNGALTTQLEKLQSDQDSQPNIAALIRAWHVERFRDNPEFAEKALEQYQAVDPVFKMVEAIRITLAKHEDVGKPNSIPRMPGYGRINMTSGALNFEVNVKGQGMCYYNRRDVADAMKAMDI